MRWSQQSEINPAEDLAYQVEPAAASGDADLGMVEVTIVSVCGEDEAIPPR